MERNGKMKVLEIVAPGAGQEGVAAGVWPEAEIVQDELSLDWLKCPTKGLGHYDAIVASHVLQTLDGTEVVQMVRWFASLLREEGELHLVVPDLTWACEQVAKEHEVDRWTLMVIYGQGGQEHRSGFTVGLLRSVLAAAGLKAKAARLGPYAMVGMVDGKEREVIARQIYVVGVKGAVDKQAESEEV